MTDDTSVPAEAETTTKIPFFGTRRRAHELTAELSALRRRTEELGSSLLPSCRSVGMHSPRRSPSARTPANRESSRRGGDATGGRAAPRDARATSCRHESVPCQSGWAFQELLTLVTVTEEVAFSIGWVFEHLDLLSDSIEYQGIVER